MGDELCASVVEAMGGTPLVELGRFVRRRGLEGRILAKLEYVSPGGSKKDRIARQIIADAEAAGELVPGQCVVELTSGNTGTGLAIVCAVRGYPFVAVMSRGNSGERARMMQALGAEVVLVDQCAGSRPGRVSGEDLARVEAEARRIVAARGAFRADQFHHRGNVRAHELHTGPELLRQSGGSITAFCDFVGTGGTLAGCARALKAHDAGIACYGVEPSSAAVLGGAVTRPGEHRIQGGGYAMRELAMLEGAVIDGYVSVKDEQAVATARALAAEEGIFAGYSSGANVAAAVALLAGPCRGGTVAVVMCDTGLKYMSTGLWG